MDSPTSTPPGRRVAILLVALTILAFAAIVVGLAMGQIAVAGTGGLALVVLWFVVRHLQRRGGS
jgi:hypothetical protein